MEIHASRVNIKIEISGRVSQRERRAMLLASFRRITPLFRLIDFEGDFESGWIVHRDGSWENAFRDLKRGIKLRQSVKSRTPEQKLGYEIRTRRLRSGLSQEKLADAANLTRTQLSRIEHGHCRVKLKTLRRIEEQLDGRTAGAQLIKPRGSSVRGWIVKPSELVHTYTLWEPGMKGEVSPDPGTPPPPGESNDDDGDG